MVNIADGQQTPTLDPPMATIDGPERDTSGHLPGTTRDTTGVPATAPFGTAPASTTPLVRRNTWLR